MKMFNHQGEQTTNFDEMVYCYGTIKELTNTIYEQAHNPYDPCLHGSTTLEYWFVRGERECDFDILNWGLVKAIREN